MFRGRRCDDEPNGAELNWRRFLFAGEMVKKPKVEEQGRPSAVVVGCREDEEKERCTGTRSKRESIGALLRYDTLYIPFPPSFLPSVLSLSLFLRVISSTPPSSLFHLTGYLTISPATGYATVAYPPLFIYLQRKKL